MQRAVVILLCALLLCSCDVLRPMHKPHTKTDTLDDLMQLNFRDRLDEQKKGMHQVRYQGVKEAAFSLGAQSGLAWQADKINEALNKNHAYLDQVFNFNALVLSNNVMPPVLTEGSKTLNLANDHTLRLADKSYHITKQARFVTTPSHWRAYLFFKHEKPEKPDASILPRNSREAAVWRANIKKGWARGVAQANRIFADNLARLKSDYLGMVLYRKLLAQKLVSEPFVAKTDLGITGGGEELSINDQVLRITALPKLEANSQKWKAVIANG